MYRQNNYKWPTSHKKKKEKIQKETQLIDIIKCYRKRTRKKNHKNFVLAIEINELWKQNNRTIVPIVM